MLPGSLLPGILYFNCAPKIGALVDKHEWGAGAMELGEPLWERHVICDLCHSIEHQTLKADCKYAGYAFVKCFGCGLMYYSPRYSETYVKTHYLSAGLAREEAQSMFEKGVFFGEPAGGP